MKRICAYTKGLSLFMVLAVLQICGALSMAQDDGPARPNIVLVMVDDMGYSDLGCYGASIIETPTIDRLAENGLRFSQFYNTAKCGPSRAALMTGLYPHQAGFRGLGHGVTIAEALAEAGYFTTMVGKWHLGSQPTRRGFDRYFGHLNGAVDYFSGQWRGNDNEGPAENHWRLNGEKFTEFPDDFYTTKNETDHAIRFIDQALKKEKPFFTYLAYNAPHYPLQAPKEAVMRYRGEFRDLGWDGLRQRRYENLQEMGMIDPEWELSPRPDYLPAWEALPQVEKDWEDVRMATYAAMVSLIDQNLKRLVDHLKKKGEWNNTLLLFLSDNGGCPFERTDDRRSRPWNEGTFWTLDAGWANVNNTPFRWYKRNQHEGGIATPMIVHWPEGLRTEPGAITHQPGHIIDIMPTVLEVAGADYPDTYDGRQIRSVEGRSLLPIFKGQKREPHDWLFFNFAGRNRAIRIGDWKLVSERRSHWELYNLKRDRTELNNLAEQKPALTESLRQFWHVVAEEVVHLSEGQRRSVTDSPPSFSDRWLTDR